VAARQCSLVSDPFTGIYALATFDTDTLLDAGMPPIWLKLLQNNYGVAPVYGLHIDQIVVQGGTVLALDNLTSSQPNLGDIFRLTIAPDSATSTLLVEIHLSCEGAAATRRYRIVYGPPGSPLPVEQLPPT
jgi:hypothetical protein